MTEEKSKGKVVYNTYILMNLIDYNLAKEI